MPTPSEPQAPPPGGDPSGSWLAPRADEAGLARYFEVVRGRIRLIVAAIVVATLAAFVYVEVAQKTYKAEADLIVTPASPDDPNLVGLPIVRSTADPTNDVLTVAKLVASPSVAGLVANQLGLHAAPRTLLARVQATPVAQSNIIAIDASAHTPAEAAALANSFARQTINQRTSALHAQLQTLVPPLIRTLGQLPPGERASLSQELAVLETLQHSPDPTLTVASNAQTPTAPASPRKALSLLAGAFGGLVLGLVAAFALQALDPRLRSEEQLRNLYRLPLLARVPKQRHKAGPIAPPDAVPAAAEAFRTLRAAFTSVGPPAGPARAILVTGDSPMLGKTTVALNLAASLTAASQQVMLIEADLRKPSIGRALGVTAPYGVGNVLVDEVDLIDALIWARPYGPGLELLLADPNGPLLLDRLSLPSARKLIHEARALADYVIIDSPPLTLISDALPLAEEVDDVLIVAGLGSSVLGKLTDLGELFVHHQIRPAGMVLVGAEPDDGEGYYGRYDLVTPSSTTLFGLLQRISPNGDRVTIS